MPKPPPPCTRPPGHETGHPHHYSQGCRCEDTRAAYNARRRARARRTAYGRRTPDVFVDAAPTRARLARMVELGQNYEQIGRATGLSPSTIAIHLGPRPRATVRASTARAVEATPLVPGQECREDYLPSIGTARRLQALSVLGWGLQQMAEESGYHKTTIADLRQQKHPRVKAITAARIRGLYDRLWNTPPVQDTPKRRGAATTARRHALESGWAPPLAWDEGEIDLPAARPRTGVLRPAETAVARLPTLLELLDDGHPFDETAATRAGYNSRESAARALHRAGRSVTEWHPQPQTARTAA